MNKFAALLLLLTLTACGSKPEDPSSPVPTNKHGQPKQFDLKGVTVGMSLDQVKAKLGDLTCKASQDRFAEMYGSDWKTNSQIDKMAGYAKYKMLLTEESDQICVSTAPQEFGNEKALSVIFLKNGHASYVSFIFTSSGDSIIEALGYKYGWISPSASDWDKKLLKTQLVMELSTGLRDQKDNVIFFISTKDGNEVSIQTQQLFEKLVSAHELDVRNQAGLGKI